MTFVVARFEKVQSFFCIVEISTVMEEIAVADIHCSYNIKPFYIHNLTISTCILYHLF